MDVMSSAIKYYNREDFINVMELIYDNKSLTFADLINKSKLNIKNLTAVLYGLSALKYIVCYQMDNKNMYFLTRQGVINYINLSNVEHIFELFEEFPLFEYDMDEVTEFLREKLYREYRYGEKIDTSRLKEEYKGFANKLEMY